MISLPQWPITFASFVQREVLIIFVTLRVYFHESFQETSLLLPLLPKRKKKSELFHFLHTLRSSSKGSIPQSRSWAVNSSVEIKLCSRELKMKKCQVSPTSRANVELPWAICQFPILSTCPWSTWRAAGYRERSFLSFMTKIFLWQMPRGLRKEKPRGQV